MSIKNLTYINSFNEAGYTKKVQKMIREAAKIQSLKALKEQVVLKFDEKPVKTIFFKTLNEGLTWLNGEGKSKSIITTTGTCFNNANYSIPLPFKSSESECVFYQLCPDGNWKIVEKGFSDSLDKQCRIKIEYME